MDVLVANLIEAYRQSITQYSSGWGRRRVSARSRARRVHAERSATPCAGATTRACVSTHDVLANVRAASEFEFCRNLDKIGQPVDRDEWFMTPQMVNAYYNPASMKSSFRLRSQRRSSTPEREEAANYGASAR